MSDFNTRLKKIRIENNLSQDRMAELLECSRTKIVGWEKKEPSFVKFLFFLYQNYNINLNWFITGEGNMFNPKTIENNKDDILIRVENIEKILLEAGFLSKNGNNK